MRPNQGLLPRAVSEKEIRSVEYDSKNHISVLSQMYGSVWPKVLPYCIMNALLTLVIFYLKYNRGIDLTFSDRGHDFMGLLVSFLIVARSNITYGRYMEARGHLTDCMKSCRELMHYVVTFSRKDHSPKAMEWRAEVARRTVILLRTVVSVLQYQAKGEHAWKAPELSRDEKQALLQTVGKSNERSPIVLVIFLRSTITSHSDYLQKGIDVNEMRLHQCVSDFMTAYHHLMKLITTPFPFPLVQMARTFLYIWIFSLPFGLVRDIEDIFASLVIISALTFGFVGLEYVSIELDDPFGDDPNDFDVVGLAQAVYEDIFIAVYDVDGKSAADKLRRNIYSPLGELAENEMQTHKRLSSDDAWYHASPAMSKVGIEKCKLLRDESNEKENGVHTDGHHIRYSKIGKGGKETDPLFNKSESMQ